MYYGRRVQVQDTRGHMPLLFGIVSKYEDQILDELQLWLGARKKFVMDPFIIHFNTSYNVKVLISYQI